VVLFAVVLYGGYVEHWKWTGINGHTATLWDWLHLLLLPMVVAILPIWMSRKARLTAQHKRWSAIALGVFAMVVLLGYTMPWAWTGFVGNTVWDWLGLIALPVAVALAPIYGELRRGWSHRHTLLAAVLVAAFAIICLGGYIANWAWTGFHGNTVWDWMHLLLLPLLIPAVVVPALKPMAIAAVTPEAGGERARPQAAGDPTAEQARPLQTSNR
jgi:uncharacterized membrane protein